MRWPEGWECKKEKGKRQKEKGKEKAKGKGKRQKEKGKRKRGKVYERKVKRI